jgi:hypothetical protein
MPIVDLVTHIVGPQRSQNQVSQSVDIKDFVFIVLFRELFFIDRKDTNVIRTS